MKAAPYRRAWLYITQCYDDAVDVLDAFTAIDVKSEDSILQKKTVIHSICVLKEIYVTSCVVWEKIYY